MTEYTIGQRWLSETESDLGLGTISDIADRTVTVTFPACDETRVYATNNAPLARIIFKKGDEIKNRQQTELIICNIKIDNFLYSYLVKDSKGEQYWLEEIHIDHHTQLNHATERLFSGQIDAEKWFALRYRTLVNFAAIEQASTYGLSGARIDLIPHQLYIAYEVSKRYSPRVLLADEVGLGKTIEACLILHQQYLTESVHRVLIIVPEALIHQWLVELLRRVNLRFSLFDEDRCISVEESDANQNPFETSQLILCSLEMFSQYPKRARQIIHCQWDMLIIDEAHHLRWSPDDPSAEYLLVEVLAKTTSSVLLLTATPEQLGQSGHFARLRLLDPERYHSLDSFIKQENSYFEIVDSINTILEEKILDSTNTKKLLAIFPDPSLDSAISTYNDYINNNKPVYEISQNLVNKLIDQHGTGRCLFRNNRFAIKGFPKRILIISEMETPIEYKLEGELENKLFYNQYPECFYSQQKNNESTPWWQFDPRIEYLYNTFNQLKSEKILIICANKHTAMDIKTALNTRYGINIAMFHEDMSIIQRDKSAAYFSNTEQGTQALVCSEIGSEGRNFQFAHHLILFDLPLLPDMLEQRIGRLDRIGQHFDVQIHALYLKNTAQHCLFRWYHQGLNAFVQTCPAGQTIYGEFKHELLQHLCSEISNNSKFNSLITRTQARLSELNTALQSGRDRLLELNSHRKNVSQEIINSIKNNSFTSELIDYMEHVFGCYGVNFEEHSLNQYVIHPSEHMHTAHFPLLPEDGATITFDRNTALAHEDVEFLSWEHPMVTAIIELISSSETGNTAVSLIKHKSIASGTLLLECMFVIKCAAPKHYRLAQYLPKRYIHTVIDNKLKDYSFLFSNQDVYLSHEPVSKNAAQQLVKNMLSLINKILTHSETLATHYMDKIIAKAETIIRSKMSFEIERLIALQKQNPNIRDEEIEHMNTMKKNMLDELNNAVLQLDALRVIVVE